jgi:hypothetical protein
MGLLELISNPINQLNEYEQRLEALVNTTPKDHPGLDELVSAAALMKETNKYVKEAMQESQNKVEVLKVQRKLADNYEVRNLCLLFVYITSLGLEEEKGVYYRG